MSPTKPQSRGCLQHRRLPPPQQEAQEHAKQHLPFRRWCPFCVKGESNASPHLVQGGKGEHEVPIVAFGHCVRDDRDVGKDNMKLLVGSDAKSGCYSVMAAQQKALDPAEYYVTRCLRCF